MKLETKDYFSLLGRVKPLLAADLKKDFAAFCRAAWPHLHPGSALSWTPAHDLICDRLVAVWEKKLTRLIINCPPRFAKSSIVTILFPVWIWLQDATKDFLCCSYEIDLAVNHNQDRRRLLVSEWFRGLFGNAIELSGERAKAEEFSNRAGGTMQAASTSSKATGRGGHFVILDDPLSADFAYSDAFRTEVNFWLEHQLPQRLNHPSESAIIVVAQRLHENDPCGFLLAQENSEWTLLKLALIAEEDESFQFLTSKRVWKRKKGSCLDPRRWSDRTVRERQRNRLVFAGQFQQSPMAAEGNIIRVDDVLFYGGRDPQTGVRDPGLPETFDRKIVSVDCSFKDLRTSDYVCVAVIGILGARRYLLHVTNAHLDLAATLNEIRFCRAAYGPISATLVEDAANGASVLAALKDEVAGLLAVTPSGGKMSRMVAMSPEFQGHNWIIERNGPHTAKVIAQLTMFPNAKHDDICDALSQASVWLQSNAGEFGLLAWFRRKTTELLAPQAKDKVETEKEKPRSCPHCGSTKLLPLVVAGLPQSSCTACFKTSSVAVEKPSCCPFCGDVNVRPIPAGQWQCDAHSHQWAPGEDVVTAPRASCGCSNPLIVRIGTQSHCNNCAWDSPAPVARGFTFEQLRSRRFRGYMLEGPDQRYPWDNFSKW